MDTSSLTKLLKQEGRPFRRARGQIINVGLSLNEFNLIESGYVKRYLIRNNGSLSVQSVYGPNYFFPVNPVFDMLFNYKIENWEQFYYECMTPVEFYSVSLDTLGKALGDKRRFDLYRDLLAVMGRRLESQVHRVTNDALDSAHTKVAHQLAFLAKVFGRPAETGYEIELPLRHQDLADMLNMSRETVSKQLSILHKEGLIHTSPHIVVTDLERLIKEYS